MKGKKNDYLNDIVEKANLMDLNWEYNKEELKREIEQYSKDQLKFMKNEVYCAVFYDEDEKEIGRKTYSSYGRLITHGYKRAERIGAKFFFHVEYLRRFEIVE